MKALRKKWHLTQKQLHDITGIPVRSISNWECGIRKPPQYIIDLAYYKVNHEMELKKTQEEIERLIKS